MSRRNFWKHRRKHWDFYQDTDDWKKALDAIEWKCRDKDYRDRECWYGVLLRGAGFTRYLKFVLRAMSGNHYVVITAYATVTIEENLLLCERV